MVYSLYLPEEASLILFEFDEAKSASNKLKHGLDFVEAQAVWRDPKRTITPARAGSEERLAVVGLIDDRHWTAVITMCAGTIRLISVRRARAKEVAIYEQEEHQH